MQPSTRSLLAGLAALSFSLVSPAQTPQKPAPRAAEESPRREIVIWGGGTAGHPHIIVNVKSDPGGERLILAGVRFGLRLWDPSKITLRGNLGITPVAVYTQPTGGSRSYAYGGGISAGLELAPKTSWRIEPYGDAGIGCLIFARPTPVADARRFNYAFYVGPGIRIARSRWRVGLWYHHFSNARTAPNNPGVDSLILYLGYSLHRR